MRFLVGQSSIQSQPQKATTLSRFPCILPIREDEIIGQGGAIRIVIFYPISSLMLHEVLRDRRMLAMSERLTCRLRVRNWWRSMVGRKPCVTLATS